MFIRISHFVFPCIYNRPSVDFSPHTHNKWFYFTLICSSYYFKISSFPPFGPPWVGTQPIIQILSTWPFSAPSESKMINRHYSCQWYYLTRCLQSYLCMWPASTCPCDWTKVTCSSNNILQIFFDLFLNVWYPQPLFLHMIWNMDFWFCMALCTIGTT